MTVYLKDKVIAVSGAELEAVKQELINTFQEKRITFDGVPDVLLTTALDTLLTTTKGKANIYDVNELPIPTTPSTLYFVKTYNGTTKTSGRFIILTDSNNASVFIGETSGDTSGFVEKTQIQTELGDTNYYYSFGSYYTKTMADGSVDVYEMTLDTDGDITGITKLSSQGTLSNGVLTVSGTNYNHSTAGDGYYIVGYKKKVLAVSALRGLKSVSGGGGGGTGTYTAGRGISIYGDEISVADPTLVNRASVNTSIAIGSNSSTANSISLGTGTNVGAGGIAIGRSAYANGQNATAIGFGATASGANSVVIGYGGRTSSGTPGTVLLNASGRNASVSDPNTLFFANTNSIYNVIDQDGFIPAARMASTTGAATGNILTLGSNGRCVWSSGGGGGGGEEVEDISGSIVVDSGDYINYVKGTKSGNLVQITICTKQRAVATSGVLIPKFTKLFTIASRYRPNSAIVVNNGIQFCLAPTSDISSATSGWQFKQSALIIKDGTGQVYNMSDITAGTYNVSVPTTATLSYYMI